MVRSKDSSQTFDAPQALTVAMEPGDELRVTMRSGDLHELHLGFVSGDALVAEDLELAFADIAVIEREEPRLGAPKVVFLAALGAFVVVAMANWSLS